MKSLLYTLLYIGCLTTLYACGDELEELGYTPAAINDNAHTAYVTDNSSDNDNPNEGDNTDGDWTGTLAGMLNTTYTGLLQVTINEESNTPTQQTILIERVDGTHINFMLNNFMLANGEESLPVGTIQLKNIELQKEGELVTFHISENINIEAGDPAIAEEWAGPLLPPVPVVLKGKGNQQGMDIDIDIDMMETLGQIIHVDFATNTAQ